MARENETDRVALTKAEKWEVSKLVVAIIFPVVVVLGAAGYFVAKNIADETAKEVATLRTKEVATEVAERIANQRISEIPAQVVKDPEFLEFVTNAIEENLAAMDGRVDLLEKVITSAVIAFNLPESNCPEGWDVYKAAQGRIVLGAGEGNDDEEDNPLVVRQKGETGGFETVKLALNQIPNHAHAVPKSPGDGDPSFIVFQGGQDNRGRWNHSGEAGNKGHFNERQATAGISGHSGKLEAHPNMPPYVVLYYCTSEKSAE